MFCYPIVVCGFDHSAIRTAANLYAHGSIDLQVWSFWQLASLKTHESRFFYYSRENYLHHVFFLPILIVKKAEVSAVYVEFRFCVFLNNVYTKEEYVQETVVDYY